ncbi:MAG: carboxylating nicotinate-nucleotide diphosphorylase [Armatimonadota bacterium]|nr:carboxylating nicotinate-nucleotide diphosphorylase [Armatimonadota bacterium]
MSLNFLEVENIVRRALAEDIGAGDITTALTVPSTSSSRAQMVVKQDGVICGLQVAALTFNIVAESYASGENLILRRLQPGGQANREPLLGVGGPTRVSIRHMNPVEVVKAGAPQPISVAKGKSLTFRAEMPDGSHVEAGDVVAEITGPTAVILTAERTALNFVQRLSGIATMTSRFVALVQHTKTVITDTRKTTPGLRILEKYAVRVGGGQNHRFGLYDAILIKDNHILAAGGITEAVAAAKARAPHTMKIEVEAETLEQVEEALAAGADIILLDNMSPAMLRKAVALCKGKALTEASGNATESSIARIAETGVDMISVGALTHSVKALDVSLEIVG